MPKKIKETTWLVQQELKRSLNSFSKKPLASQTLLLAVSGGADSLALADAAAALQSELAYKLLVCHVEHGLRGEEALADAALVEKFCQQRQILFHCCHIKVKEFCDAQGCSVEEGARLLRYAALEQQALAVKAGFVLTAHHRDDQIETFWLRLLRGAGPEGLTGMKSCVAKNGYQLLRPFLNLSRRQLETYCQEQNIHYCQDSSNQDCYYTRNKIRRELLPELEQKYNPALRENILHTMRLLAEQEAYLSEQEAWWCSRLLNFTEDNSNKLEISAKSLLTLAPLMRKRLYRQAYFKLGGKELSYERTEAIDKLVSRQVGAKKVQLPQKIMVEYRKGKLFFYKDLQ